MPPSSHLLVTNTKTSYSLVQSVKDDVAIIKSSKYMRTELAEQVSGFIYDIKTGKLNPVQT